ncbi:Stage II sporulation protein E (SpoIIE) [Candidatus Methanoperedens nitroreducens]|uniref:Stage II sporulation protein E (SpoIIE) n=1 Tax=Candidatus Methanoperedens nitratireducens TaxID=1392998 RepID=A0A062V6T0_9EURY|nr:SpoIIE family protein phosphatase [Candidatus Methanoperedens nitroreducens]KCZ71459.1 Stage II sporulation protein E (SpoIIE) [Candidatus Methanoperedens nitroreducens]
MLIECGVSMMAAPGQSVSGDRHIIKQFVNGVLIAVMDGLGHGYEAAVASRVAINTLDIHASEPVISLIRRCHEALKGTRGVVMSIASLNLLDNTMVWLGVGNVEGMLLRTDAKVSQENLPLRGGVLGYHLPPLKVSVTRLMPGDILIFVTDGIRSGFEIGLDLSEQPQQIADHIMAQCARGTDDALVLVVRYKGIQEEGNE